MGLRTVIGNLYMFGGGTSGGGIATDPIWTGAEQLAYGTGSGIGATFTMGTGVRTFLTTPSGSNLASALATPLSVIGGGTGISNSYTTGDMLYASDANTLAKRAAVAIGNVLVSQGTNTAPVWSTTPQFGSSGVPGTVTLGNGTSGTLTITAPTGALGTASVTLPPTGTISTLAGNEELTNKTLNASVGKGTWTASGTWTLPAFTINSAITGGVGSSLALGGATIGSNAFAATGTGFFSGTLTLGDGSGATAILASNLSGATDPTITFGNAAVTISHALTLTTGGLTGNGNVNMASGNNNFITGSGGLFSWNSNTRLYTNGNGGLSIKTSGDVAKFETDSSGNVTTANNGTFAGKLASTGTTPATLGVGATTFAVTSNLATVTGDSGGNTVATITGGVSGMVLHLLFTDNKITITDTAANTADTVNLSAAFTSADRTVLTLVHNGTKWFEVSRSVN